MRSCEQFELLASLAVDGEASPEEQTELAEHLETCPGCRAYFEDISRIHQTFAREEVVVPEGFSAHVMDRVRETAQDRPEAGGKTIRFPRWKRWSALAACCALAALSLWAARSAGGVKNATVAMDAAPPAPMQAEAQSIPEEDLEAKASGGSLASGEADADSVLEEVPPPMPEEYEDLAKSAAKHGEGEGSYQPLIDPQSDGEPALAASLPPDNDDTTDDTLDGDLYDRESLPASDGAEQKRTDAPPPGEEGEPAADNTLAGPEPDLPAAVPAQEEEPDAAEEPAPEPEEPPAVAPVEVVGVPEPGILIAYGNAAQAWVEDVLGLEWAIGGSYPLTAEQYSDLQRTLDEAGEDYTVADGKGYCLMTE